MRVLQALVEDPPVHPNDVLREIVDLAQLPTMQDEFEEENDPDFLEALAEEPAAFEYNLSRWQEQQEEQARLEAEERSDSDSDDSYETDDDDTTLYENSEQRAARKRAAQQQAALDDEEFGEEEDSSEEEEDFSEDFDTAGFDAT